MRLFYKLVRLLQFLKRCDEIYMMSEGKIVEHGTHEDLVRLDREYASMVKSGTAAEDNNLSLYVSRTNNSRFISYYVTEHLNNSRLLVHAAKGVPRRRVEALSASTIWNCNRQSLQIKIIMETKCTKVNIWALFQKGT